MLDDINYFGDLDVSTLSNEQKNDIKTTVNRLVDGNTKFYLTEMKERDGVPVPVRTLLPITFRLHSLDVICTTLRNST
jgi:hypothetical protein